MATGVSDYSIFYCLQNISLQINPRISDTSIQLSHYVKTAVDLVDRHAPTCAF